MEVTWIGIITIGFTSFLLLRHKLSTVLKLAIFFLPFGTLAVINVFWQPGFGIGLDQYFAALLMLSLFVFGALHKYKGPHLPRVIKWLFFIFLFAIVISWMVPIYSSGDIKIWGFSERDRGFSEALLIFSVNNITKTIYLLFSVLFFVSICKTLKLLRPLQISRIFIASCFLVAISSLLDFIPNISILWSTLMNNISYSRATNLITGYFGVPRISGIMAEPSHLVQFLIIGLAIIVALYINNFHIFSRKIDFIILLLLALVSILTFSPVFIGGFLIIAVYCLIKLILCNKRRRKRALNIIGYGLMGIAVVVLILQYLIGINVFQAVVLTALGKLGMFEELAGFKSTFRIQNINAALEAFKQSPLIGVGWGTLSLQVGLPLFLLATTGILGFTIFSCLLIFLLVIGVKKIKKSNSIRERALREGFLVAFLIMIGIFSITKGTIAIHYLPVWFITAGLISSYNINNEKKP